MERPVILLAAGGHARVLLDALRSAGEREVLGICVADRQRVGEQVGDLPVVVADEDLAAMFPPEVADLVNGLGSSGDCGPRRRLYERMQGNGYRFAAVVHPRTIVATDVRLGEGVQIMAGAVVQTGCRLGENVIINTGAVVDHDCDIGAHAHIAPGVTLSGGVRVGKGTHVGTGACVIQGVSIGAGALVGAGAVVLRDVPAGVTVAGVPAREIGR